MFTGTNTLVFLYPLASSTPKLSAVALAEAGKVVATESENTITIVMSEAIFVLLSINKHLIVFIFHFLSFFRLSTKYAADTLIAAATIAAVIMNHLITETDAGGVGVGVGVRLGD